MTFDAALESAAGAVVALAFSEDLGGRERPVDVTGEALLGAETARAVITANQEGVVAGLFVAGVAFAALDATLDWEAKIQDGDRVKPGMTVATVKGRLKPILTGERTALNLLSHLSGVATRTRAYADAVVGSGVAIYDTRKTTPGLRVLEKYAVTVGGGRNHRFGLYDALLIKDNHLVGRGAGEAVAVAKRHWDGPIEVEVETLDQLEQALGAGADIILLDNMDMPTLKEAVLLAKGAAEIEVSGGVRLDNVAEIAALGVERISVGALTQGVPALDFSLTVKEVYGRA